MRRRLVTSVYLVGVVVIPCLALAAAVLIPGATVEGLVEPTREDVTVPLVVAPNADERAFQVQLSWSEPVDVVANTGLDGVVTQVEIAPGDRVSTADRLFDVDGIQVVALASDEPLIADVTAASRREDLRSVADVLETLGLLDEGYEVTQGWNTALEDAVRAYRAQLGLSEDPVVFERRFVMWVPREPFEVGQVSVAVGRPAPQAGEVVVTSRPALTDLRLAGDDGPASSVAGVLPGGYEVSLDGERLGVWVPGEQPSASLTERLGTLVDDEVETVLLQARLASPVDVVSLPASAITDDVAGRTCVWEATDPPTPVPVEVLRGSGGRVEVAAPGVRGDVFVVAGRVIQPGASCAP